MSGGGRFDFDDGGTYCGGWEDGKAHGYGVCTGPKGQGEYSGAWSAGFEASGVYNWPSGNNYKGQWLQGKRHGLGVETKGRWVYRGEWTQGFKGRYGVRQSTSSGAKYEGTWTTGLQDGYGVETYADGGSYQGQWLRGMRHGYGVRHSVPYGLASHYRPKALRASLTSLRSEAEDDHVVKDRDRKVDESRGGFVLKAKSDESPTQRRRSLFDKHGRSSLRKGILNGLKLRKQKSTGDIKDSPRRPTGSVRSTVSNISNASAESSASGVTSASMYTDSNLSFVSQDDINDVNVTETYMGEWKNDKRSGFGISERSDGLKYEGEWYNNKKYGYGVTTFKDGTKEEGKYKNNVLISSGKKSKLFLIRSSKMRERVDNAVTAAQRAAQIAHQKADIAITRMANARAKAESAEDAAERSIKDSELARIKAKEFAPDFIQPGTDLHRQHLPSPTEDLTHQHYQHHQHHDHPAYQRSSSSSNHTKPNMARMSVQSAPPGVLTNHEMQQRASSPVSNTSMSPLSSPTRDSYPGSSQTSRNSKGGVQQSPMSALVSSAMDCVIGPSSTEIAGNLRRLEGDHHHRPTSPSNKAFSSPTSSSSVRANHQASSPSSRGGGYGEEEPYDDRYGSPGGGGPGPPRQPEYARQNHITPVHADPAYSRVPDPHERPYSPPPLTASMSADRMAARPSSNHRGGYDTMPSSDAHHRRGGSYDHMDSHNQMSPQQMDPRFRSGGGGYDSLPHDNRYRKPVDPYDPIYSRTKRDDSGLGPEMDMPSPDEHQRMMQQQPAYSSLPRHMPNQQPGYAGGYGMHPLDRSPDSGMSDSEDFRYLSRPLVRRKTLPSIMKAPPGMEGGPPNAATNATIANNTSAAHPPTPAAMTPGAMMTETPPKPEQDLYVIENGIRKRVKAEVHAQPVRPNAERPKDVMPNRLKLEKMASRGAKGSLPDVSNVHNAEVMPREIVAELSAKRRAELLAMSDEEKRRKQQELVLRLSDLKDWCQQRQLMMLVIALNVSLATMFFNLLSQ